MRYVSIGELAKKSGVSTRTLRHYEEVGLLNPVAHERGGIRLYDQAGMLRLQRILTLRELGLGLPEIAGVLAEHRPLVQALEDQAAMLEAQVRRITKMKRAVQSTLNKIRNGESIMPEEIFDGFESGEYSEEARERWPNEYEESHRRYGKLSSEQKQEIQNRHDDIAAKLALLYKAKVAADSPEVQAEVDRHYGWVCEFWTPSADAYIGLGEIYVSDERFTATYDAFAPGLAPFIRDAILHYAASRLA